MRPLLAVIILASVTAAAAAQTPMPRTVPFNDKDGNQIGTATFSGDKIYLRDLKGEFIATVAIAADGTRTLYDPHGKILDRLPGKLPEVQ
jgi:hypothetical protein